MSDAGLETPKVAVVDDADLTLAGRLAAALDRTGFWNILAHSQQGRPAEALHLLIKPELAGFTSCSPLVTEPSLVEALIDLLHDRGFTNVAVVGTADSSALWAENRDLYALSDLLGYRFVTSTGRAYDISTGRAYDIVDLGDAGDEAAFPVDSALHGTGISRAWVDADFRIVFAKNRTDEEIGYALALDTLIGVLPLPDKTLHYRRRRQPGDVVTALLAAAPVHFVLIDAITSAHGVGGRRSPDPIETNTLIAASDIVLADYVGALKMGLDPGVSPILVRVIRGHPLPARYTVSGTLAPYCGWRNVSAPVLRATQARAGAAALDRLVEPWLQCLDPELFPLKNPLDARLNAALAKFFADTGDSPTSEYLLVLANLLLGLVGQAVESYRTLFDKDKLHQRAVPLGIDLASIEDDAFERLVEELVQLEPTAASAPTVSDSLRWRYVEDAVVFNYSRMLPIDFDTFVRHVDVARTIQFMNDYLGGVIVPLAHDSAGRPIRQAERNIYLPQPNYLVLYQGKPIDVSKLEVVEYAPDRHRLYWKTIGSENQSATANFEALVEGRDIRLGRPTDEPARVSGEQLMQSLGKLGDIVTPLLQRMTRQPPPARAEERRETDADGFVHVHPVPQAPTAAEEAMPDFDRWIAEIGRFIGGLQQAVQRDLTQRSQLG